MDWHILFVVLIIFAGGLSRSTFGFGEALVAMPLLSMFVDVTTAAALVATTSILHSVAILSTDWRAIQWHATWRLIVAALVGIPFGVYGLKYIDAGIVKIVLAAVVISFALYNLVRVNLRHLASDQWAFGFGLVGGVLGGAYNTMGPPLVIYGTLRGWDARSFRITLQAIFLPTSVFVVLNHALHRNYNTFIFWCLLFSLPGMAVAVPLGRRFNRRLQGKHFTRYVFVLLIAIGIMLIATVLWERLA